MGFSSNDAGSVADMAAVMGNHNNGGLFGGDNSGWGLILFLIIILGWGNGNWGNNNGGNNGGATYVVSDVQRGFDQSAIMNGISGLSTGLANAEISRCNQQANILQAMNSGLMGVTNQLNTMAMTNQQCCCDNRAAIADLRYNVATEACADRSAVDNALRDVLAANNASTQRILDQMCQDKLDAKDEIIANLRTQLNMLNLQQSQTAQTAQILADNARQTTALEQYLNPVPIPAYQVANPNCCGRYNNNNCGNF